MSRILKLNTYIRHSTWNNSAKNMQRLGIRPRSWVLCRSAGKRVLSWTDRLINHTEFTRTVLYPASWMPSPRDPADKDDWIWSHLPTPVAKLTDWMTASLFHSTWVFSRSSITAEQAIRLTALLTNSLHRWLGTWTVIHSWRRSTVVKRWSMTGELSLSCAWLLAGRMITLWVRRPL